MAQDLIPETAFAGTDFNCFGCAPANPIGLHLAFTRQGAGLVTRVLLGREYESFPGRVHGGLVATILDEAMAQAAYASGLGSVVTTALRVRYGQPMRIGAEHTVCAEVRATDADLIRASGRIELPGGILVAAADGTFFCPPILTV
jgi:acyl-coenzyme A thioesterase PaaI-like protein